MFSLEIFYLLTPLQELPKYVGDLDILIASKGFKSCPNSNKLPYLVTLYLTAKASFTLVAGRSKCCRELGCVANNWKIFELFAMQLSVAGHRRFTAYCESA